MMKMDRAATLASVDKMMATIDAEVSKNSYTLAERVQRTLESAAPQYGLSGGGFPWNHEQVIDDGETRVVLPPLENFHFSWEDHQSCELHHHYCRRNGPVDACKLDLNLQAYHFSSESLNNQIYGWDLWFEYGEDPDMLTARELYMAKHAFRRFCSNMQVIFEQYCGQIIKLRRQQAHDLVRGLEVMFGLWPHGVSRWGASQGLINIISFSYFIDPTTGEMTPE